MRAEETIRRATWALALWAGTLLPVARAQRLPRSRRPPPRPRRGPRPVALPADPDEALRGGLDRERSCNWGRRDGTSIATPSSAGRAASSSAAASGSARSTSSSTVAIPTPASATSCSALPRAGRRALRRGPRADPVQLRRRRAAGAPGPPRPRQSRGRPPRSGVPQGRTPRSRERGSPGPGDAPPASGRLDIPDRAAAIRMAVRAASWPKRLGVAATPVLLEFTCGACDALDDFTSYLTPDKLEDLYAMIDGNFVGLGIELKIDKEGLRLVGVIRGGPAWEAGMKAGETIVKVDGVVDQGAGPRRGGQPAPGRRGDAPSTSTVQREDGTLRSVSPGSPPRRRRERHQGEDRRSARRDRLSPPDGLPEDLDRRDRHGHQRRSRARGCECS